VIEDAATNPEPQQEEAQEQASHAQSQDIKVEASSQTEITEEKQETFVTQMDDVQPTASRRSSCTAAATTASTHCSEESVSSSVEVLTSNSGESVVIGHAPLAGAPVEEFDQLIAQYASKLESKETSLKKSLDEQKKIQEELRVYKKRNDGLEEKYQFTVQLLDSQKEMTSKTRGDHEHAVIKLRDTEHKLKEMDQSMMLLKHKQIELQRQKSKLCVIL